MTRCLLLGHVDLAVVLPRKFAQQIAVARFLLQSVVDCTVVVEGIAGRIEIGSRDQSY